MELLTSLSCCLCAGCASAWCLGLLWCCPCSRIPVFPPIILLHLADRETTTSWAAPPDRPVRPWAEMQGLCWDLGFVEHQKRFWRCRGRGPSARAQGEVKEVWTCWQHCCCSSDLNIRQMDKTNSSDSACSQELIEDGNRHY